MLHPYTVDRSEQLKKKDVQFNHYKSAICSYAPCKILIFFKENKDNNLTQDKAFEVISCTYLPSAP
jgi:hypothetical protein